MKGNFLANLLAHHDVVDWAAITDPEGYDGGAMLKRIQAASDELNIIGLREENARLRAEINELRSPHLYDCSHCGARLRRAIEKK